MFSTVSIVMPVVRMPPTRVIRLLIPGALSLFSVLFSGTILADGPPAPLASAPAPAPASTASGTSDTLSAILWMQSAAEYDALALQTYQMAGARLESVLQMESYGIRKPRAIILDIDETVFQNTPFAARMLVDGKRFEYRAWQAWVKRSASSPVPGATSYIQFAMQQNLHIVYLTNRSKESESYTRKNLAKYGLLPEADHVTFYFKEDEKRLGGSTAKTAKMRRLYDAYSHFDVLQVFGDSLDDFVGESLLTENERRLEVSQYREQWGLNWFMLPNPVYGSWRQILVDDKRHDPMASFEKGLELLKPMPVSPVEPAAK